MTSLPPVPPSSLLPAVPVCVGGRPAQPAWIVIVTVTVLESAVPSLA